MESCYGTRSFPQLVDLPGAWHGNQFSHESEYVYNLSSQEVEEIENALCHFKDGDLICRQNFPLPTVGKSLDRIRLDVHEGKGFGLVRGINPLDYGVQSYIANLRGRQDEKGNMLVHVVADNSSNLSSQHHRHSTSEIVSVTLEIETKPGDIHFINNLFILHKRDSFKNGDGVGEKRHLFRMRLRDDELGWNLLESLRKEWADAFGAGLDKLWHVDPMPEGYFPLRSYPN
ncbi:hypothetical protein FOBRF1_015950 [Fusarium oxysporum]